MTPIEGSWGLEGAEREKKKDKGALGGSIGAAVQERFVEMRDPGCGAWQDLRWERL
jgi:hypothetical protein